MIRKSALMTTIPPLPPATLFDPARHVELTPGDWSEADARAAIARIVEDCLGAFTPEGLWPAHPLDEPRTPASRYSMLYMGAGGIIWSLLWLVRFGLAPDLTAHVVATIPGLVDRNRATGLTDEGGTASYLMGDSGLLLLHWKMERAPEIADRLFEVVHGNLHHPATEMLWGSPGTMVAALHMAEATGEARWVEVFESGACILLEQMTFDDALAAWLWRQDLYGRTRCFLGGGHGLVGNVYPILRGAGLLPPDLVEAFLARTWSTLDKLALRADGCLNWHPIHDPVAVAGRVPPVQDCHGAPGIVVRLASAPRTPAWDAMLAQAGELVWRAGPLRKGPGLCHGTAGNGFAFLKLWTRTSDALWLARARSFAVHAIAQVEAERELRGHGRHSLWTGDIGVALFLSACIHGDSSFPTLDMF
jgi:hypothetical protein